MISYRSPGKHGTIFPPVDEVPLPRYNSSKKAEGETSMPMQIIHADPAKITADAIVSSTGSELPEVREQDGNLISGEAVITPASGFPAKYSIYVSGPVWQDGRHGEEETLRRCYETALSLAVEHHCKSIVFPLLSAGSCGFPKDIALKIAADVFREFLAEQELLIILAVPDRRLFSLPKNLRAEVKRFLKDTEEGLQTELACSCSAQSCPPYSVREFRIAPELDLSDLLSHPEAGFSETLLKLIARTGKKDSEIYKKANVDRKLFSKIRHTPDYRPSKATAVAFAIALELNLDETKDFLSRACFALSHSSKADIIVEYFIRQKNYDIFQINETLFAFGQPLLGV